MVRAHLKRFALRFITGVVRWERWILVGLGVAFVGSLCILLMRFYWDSTILVPTTGGTYIEGSVGELLPWNPWFTVNNDVNRDIVSLVFAGLLRYNPQTKQIEDDLATVEMSKDRKVYTAHLKDNIYWHDHSEKTPHPVTADDVVFTFKTIQDPAFPNTLLRQNFQGVTIEKVDDRTVRFILDEPYHFFPSNLTLGLLPQMSFAHIPVGNLDQAIDFGLEPIGAGPYRFKSLIQTELNVEVTLERFPRALPPAYRLDRVVFRIFPDYQSLLSDLQDLDGIRLVPHNDQGEPAIPSRFKARNYSLPQYVGLFFNLSRSALKDKNLRLGLQLGTNKQEISDMLVNAAIVDTPLLEIDNSDWRYHFDPDAAQGALFESQWYFPEKIRLQHLLEQKEANDVGPFKLSPIVLLQTGATLRVTGSFGDRKQLFVNGLEVTSDSTASGSWFVNIPGGSGTGALALGENLVRFNDETGRIIDSFYIWRTTNADDYRLADGEQQLLAQFVQSRNNQIPADQRITVKDLTLERGFLRLRTPQDPIGTRVNDAGKLLVLTLLTSPSPPDYKRVAEDVKEQWAKLGVQVNIEIPATREAFEERLLLRDYDVLLFGQSLLDNLDSYPYWHTSGMQKNTTNRNELKLDAYNLSQYSSFEADTLLETIRSTVDEKERADALTKLQAVLKRDVPAIFLYTPLYTFAHRDGILGIELGDLSLHSDRFLTLYRWYVKQERVFKPGTNWMSFFSWMLSQSENEAPDSPSLVGSGAAKKAKGPQRDEN